MIVCPTCSKENQDHYKFCLGCGSDLPRPGGESKPPVTATPPAGIAAVSAPATVAATEPPAAPAPAAPTAPATPATTAISAAPAPATQVAEPPPSQGTSCANCGAAIPPGFAFCGSCGTPIGGGARPQAAAAPMAAGSASLILIMPDGTEGGIVEIPSSAVAVGRDAGGFFETDSYLSPRHAIFKAQSGKVMVKDEASLNGVFVKILPNQSMEIKSGSVFRMGQELILFEAIDRGADGPDGTARMGSPIAGLWGRISLIVGKGRLGNSFPIGGEGIICGRERGNILFPEDGYISGVHLRVHSENGKFYITDLGSSNGSYLKLTAETALNSGDFILMGAQLFRIQA